VGVVPGLSNRWPQPAAVGDGQADATGPRPDFGGIRLGLIWSDGQCNVSTENSCGIATIGYPRVGRRQIAVGVFLGQSAGLAEHDRHVRETDLQFGEPVGDPAGRA